MQGSPAVVEILNEILTAELTAINQYFVDSRMCENWGLHGLAERFKDESIDEMRDAQSIIDRILYLDGVPNMQRMNPVRVGEDVAEKLELALALEVEAVERYNRAVALCVAEGDNGSREILEGKLRGEEEHIDWLEAQLHLVRTVGIENYLAQAIRS